MLTNRQSNFIATRINEFHSLLCLYTCFGWISLYHSKVLVVFIPSIFFNWLVDNNRCCVTRLENYFKIVDKLEDKSEGFFKRKLNTYSIKLSDKVIDRIITSITYFSFIISYYNSSMTSTICLLN